MILLENLSVSSGEFSLRDVSFEVPAGGYGALMGRTGCGKTTLLEVICGLRSVESGTILLDDIDVTTLRPAERGIGYVPQDRALFQTMSVRNNLAFALKIRRMVSGEIDDRVMELAGMLGIEPLLDRMPHGLSGGEAQRVALGRALAPDPSTLLLDEPLSALDDETKDEMVDLLNSVRKKTRVTILHVTHSLAEARRLADQILLLRDGRIEVQPSEESK